MQDITTDQVTQTRHPCLGRFFLGSFTQPCFCSWYSTHLMRTFSHHALQSCSLNTGLDPGLTLSTAHKPIVPEMQKQRKTSIRGSSLFTSRSGGVQASSASATSESSLRAVDFFLDPPVVWSGYVGEVAISPSAVGEAGEVGEYTASLEEARCSSQPRAVVSIGDEETDESADPTFFASFGTAGRAGGAAKRSAEGELNLPVAFAPVSVTPLSCDVNPSVSGVAAAVAVPLTPLLPLVAGAAAIGDLATAALTGVNPDLKFPFDPNLPLVNLNDPDEFLPIVALPNPLGARHPSLEAMLFPVVADRRSASTSSAPATHADDACDKSEFTDSTL